MNWLKMVTVFLLLFCSGSALFAQSTDALKFYGDARLRLERDYNVTGKDTRDRARYRFRFGLVRKVGESIELGARLATGNPSDQQSPHQNFGDDLSAKSINIDKIYFKYAADNAWFSVGKNSFPFWKQNEMFWDDDVTPEGVSAAYTLKDFSGESSKLTFTAGQYILQGSDDLFASTLTAGQAALHGKSGAAKFSFGAGLYYFKNSDSDTLNYNALSRQDYNVFVASAQLKMNLGEIPLVVGADYMKNLQEPTVAGLEDETNGFVAQVLVKPGQWTAGVYYAHIEKYAVVANFAQDDWWRFGSGHTDSSDLQGFELRLAYNLGNKMNLVARHYVTDMIAGSKKANRFRLDFNMKY